MDPETNTLVEGDVRGPDRAHHEEHRGAARGRRPRLGDVVKTTCYLADMDDFKAFNEVYGSFLVEPYPARTTIEAARLPLDILVEIEVIAAAAPGLGSCAPRRRGLRDRRGRGSRPLRGQRTSSSEWDRADGRSGAFDTPTA